MSNKRRFSKQKKAEIVLRLLRGESIEELSRKENITISLLSQWRQEFIEAGTDGLGKNPEESQIAWYERVLGRQQMLIELLKKKNDYAKNQRGDS